MGVSTHRFLILAIAINLLIGLSLTIYNDPNTTSTTPFTDVTGELDSYETASLTDEGIYGTVKSSADRQQEAHVGNPLIWGKRLLNVLLYSFYPISLASTTFETAIESFGAMMIDIFRALVAMLGILETYMLFINKKQS